MAKKLNIYKVVTRFVTKEMGGDNVADSEKVDYVRAKTLAGAERTISQRYIKATLATQEDLLALAKVTVIGEGA